MPLKTANLSEPQTGLKRLDHWVKMSTRFFTNDGENTLLHKFKGVFESNKDIRQFDALVGFLRASGYFAIQPFLEHVPEVRILVGINVDALMARFYKKGLLFLPDSEGAIVEFRERLEKDIQTAAYDEQVEGGILRLVDDVRAGRLKIRAHPSKRLHAKIYVFLPEGFNEHKPGAVITGSSNLTEAGLGVEERNRNYEFNVLLHQYEDVKFAADEFEGLWKESTTVLNEISKAVEASYLMATPTPFELYIKLLIEFFGPQIEFDPNSETDLPEDFFRLAYQMDAVKQGYLMLQKHHGFFLADVVGLGKTIIAALIAKKFFFHNDFPRHISEILIVVPPALVENWRLALDKFQLKTARIITNGSLHKVRDPEKYDLVIVDEAHKFRNDTAEGYDLLQRICKSPTRRRFADGTFARKKVVLVSATPLNNRPNDIRNLISLFQDLKDSTLEVQNLQRFFARRQKEYEIALRKLDASDAHAEIQRIYELIRKRVVQEITVRRTRTDLMETEQYREDLEKQGIRFPKVEKPHNVMYQLDPELEALYDETIEVLADQLTYNRYRAIGHLVPELKAKYQQADRISSQLAKIMKTLLLKRLDSSFFAFTRSLGRFRDATEAMMKMFDEGTIYIAPNLDVSAYILNDDIEGLTALIEQESPTDPSITVCTPADFRPEFHEGLASDFELLKALCGAWEVVRGDPKLDAFLAKLDAELLAADRNHPAALGRPPKLVIFSEAADTTNYLAERLKETNRRVLVVDSKLRRTAMPVVKANFDANAGAEDQSGDFDILITTEVLAEGVNLHRANVIVNYDTPWNSTRLMQRIGRVNRIGTTAETIHIYNFFPTAKVDADIELKKKAVAKLQAFHTALGEDSQVYSTDEVVENFGLFDQDIEEDRDQTLALLMELRKFRRENGAAFRRIRNLPFRCRLGRTDVARYGTSVVFIRNKRRDAFYRVSTNDELEELGFLEAAAIFRAQADEQSVELPERHHDQVKQALAAFEEALQSEAVHGQVADHQIGPNERKALQFLSLFLSLPITSSDEKELIVAAQDAVRRVRFARLQRQLNALERNQKKTPVQPHVLLERTLAILKEFPLLTAEEGGIEESRGGLTAEELKPALILSESFTK